MKVRISGNKIRFRLKEPEVFQFQKEGIISETLAFGIEQKDQLTFSISTTNNNDLSIQFLLNEITLFVPNIQIQEWTTTDKVGFEAELDTGKGKKVSILVEKDFTCLDGRQEDNIGSYPNPLA